MGGTDTPDNLIRVNVALHAFLHKLLYEEYGHWQDEVAWKCLSGQILSANVSREIRQRYMTNRFISEESRSRMSESQKRRFEEKGHPRTGVTFSEESKEKMRLSHIGQTPWNKGIKQTSEEREKNRQAQLKVTIYKCVVCGKECRGKGNLGQHIRSKH
jgi:rubrerythrin